jgi:hypothetical protein
MGCPSDRIAEGADLVVHVLGDDPDDVGADERIRVVVLRAAAGGEAENEEQQAKCGGESPAGEGESGRRGRGGARRGEVVRSAFLLILEIGSRRSGAAVEARS